MTGTEPQRSHLSREVLATAALLALGVGVRTAFAARYPATAFSDFRALIEFGRVIAGQGLSADTWHWIQFNPGLPMILALLSALSPSLEPAARTATVIATGLVPLLPLLLWRPILPLRWRVFAGALLALWPGQIFFSGVVAQENWALLPTVALGALAVRALRIEGGGTYPVAAGLLLAAAAAIRQELLVVLVPAALAAAGLFGNRGARARRALRLAIAVLLPLLALAYQRRAATGRFAITTEHGGFALLGSVVPGAAGPGWVDPKAYLASVDPGLLEDRDAARRAASGLALAEWTRRPGFHALRSVAAAARLAVDGDADDLYWGVGSPEALPLAARARGAALFLRWFPRLRWELALIQGFFLAAVVRGVRQRDGAVLVLAACVLLKFALQAVASPLGRLMVPATALEILVIALGAAALASPQSSKTWPGSLALALGAALVLLLIEPRWREFVVARDEPPRPVSRFPLEIGGMDKVFARCAVETGEVTSLEWRRAWMRPSPGGPPARATCEVPSVPAGSRIRLRLDRPDGSGKDVVLSEGQRVRMVELPGPGGFSFRRDAAP